MSLEEKKLLYQSTITDQKSKNILEKYQALKQHHPRLLQNISEDQIYEIILDQEMSENLKQLELFLGKLDELKNTGNEDEIINKAFQVILENKVLRETIVSRVNDFRSGASLYRALGENTLEEIQHLFHGGNPLSPTADSALGKFIAKHQAATIIRKFPHGPIYQTQGGEKLVVAIDQSSLNDFIELTKSENFFMHYHSPEQGTLIVAHEEFAYTYRGKQNKLKNYLNEYAFGSLLPTVLLSSTEAQRMRQYFLAMQDETLLQSVLIPWSLHPYCAKGGYNSCTHWIANIPIGDKKVNAYTFPGAIDQHASVKISDDPVLDKLPRTKVLEEYQKPNQFSQEQFSLMKRIWKVPGNEQLAYVLGVGKSQEYGLLVNPGWVAHVLTSRTEQARVPVVFYFVEDAKAPLKADFNLKISAY